MGGADKLKTIWITGASSGIGEALALFWAGENTLLILSGRNLDRLEAVASKCRQCGSNVILSVFDLTQENEVILAVSEVILKIGKIDILVNNGGVGQRSLAIDTTEQIARKLFETNFWGHVILTRHVLPFMIAKGGGTIVVMSSLSGLFGFPQRSFYCASKHALHGYFETLRLEHQNDNIHVTLVCPGRIKTNISLHAITASGETHGQMDPGQLNGVSPEYLAKKIDRAVKKNKKLILVGGKEILMAYFKRFWPWLFYRIAARINPNA